MKNILIMVDVQNGFVKTPYAEHTLVRIEDLLQRNLFDEIIMTKYWNEKGSLISRFMGWNDMCSEHEQEIRPEVAKFIHHEITKDIYSSMTDEMYTMLSDLNGGTLPEYCFILGYDTECCVAMTATEMFESGIRPLVLTNYCGSHDGEKYHNAGIVSMEHLIGPDFLIDDTLHTKKDLQNVIDRVMETQKEYDVKAGIVK
ncbi:MAG: isochorismatase family protein [Eubacteriales bacterium]|jgi:nicotinamidase-related amidase|nr:isochorismatase family protein [Eubacteriales bacterium]